MSDAPVFAAAAQRTPLNSLALVANRIYIQEPYKAVMKEIRNQLFLPQDTAQRQQTEKHCQSLCERGQLACHHSCALRGGL